MQDNSSDYLFKAYITNTAAYDRGEHDNAGTWRYFPANAEEITAAFTEIGLPISATPDMYFFDDYVSEVPGLRLALPCSPMWTIWQCWHRNFPICPTMNFTS